jgi:hypothetical protein
MVDFNIMSTVGTSEVGLAPYPGGEPLVPADKRRKIYAMIIANASPSAVTLTLRIYKDNTLEASVAIVIPASSTISIISQKHSPILIVPGGRTLKAVSSGGNINLTMAAFDE